MKNESLKTWAFKKAMNLYPMYYGTGGKVLFIKHNWQEARVLLKLNLRTRNYVGTIYGGSMFSAMDPFHTVLLINSLGKNFIVWDKEAHIKFKTPGRGRITMNVIYEDEELEEIKCKTLKHGKYIFNKSAQWLNDGGEIVCEVEKTMYVATKDYFKSRKNRV